ncbi:MAG: hypothetical protein V3U78_04710 [Thiotrichaceae bacterium]
MDVDDIIEELETLPNRNPLFSAADVRQVLEQLYTGDPNQGVCDDFYISAFQHGVENGHRLPDLENQKYMQIINRRYKRCV